MTFLEIVQLFFEQVFGNFAVFKISFVNVPNFIVDDFTLFVLPQLCILLDELILESAIYMSKLVINISQSYKLCVP